MLLAVDIGNTNIHLGMYQDGAWVHTWRARTVAEKMPDEYAVLMHGFFSAAGLSFGDVDAMIISSVVPRLTGTFVELGERYAGRAPLVVRAPGLDVGVRLDVDNPAEVGADRIVNAAAVRHLYGGPAIVIDFGTATTFDIVTADGAYAGGAIAPGIGISQDALVSRAARLYKVELVPPPSPIGRNTVHAMQSGLFLGYVAMVEGMVVRLRAAMDAPAAQVIATGGLATRFAEHTRVIQRIEPLLTLDGLRVIYDLNARGRAG